MPVTARRVLFAAHHRRAIEHTFLDELVETAQEERRLRHASVQHVVMFIVELITHRATAKLLAEKDVANPVALDRIFELGAVEMRHVAGIRRRAHVHERFDAMPSEQGQKRLERVIGMSH